jgi:SAM-dependent methyltransferase
MMISNSLAQTPLILSVGCGRRTREPGVVLLDISAELNPDVIWDLNSYPYPFEDSTFQIIECFDVIEHVDNIVKVFQEFYRILSPGGVIKITTPHYSCANSFIDPTHKWHLSYFSFDYFLDTSDLNYYSSARFKIATRHLYFQGGRINRSIIRRLANRFPKTYEDRFAWIFPAHYLYFELVSLKPLN